MTDEADAAAAPADTQASDPDRARAPATTGGGSGSNGARPILTFSPPDGLALLAVTGESFAAVEARRNPHPAGLRPPPSPASGRRATLSAGPRRLVAVKALARLRRSDGNCLTMVFAGRSGLIGRTRAAKPMADGTRS
jgi:hypothetical protein